MMKNTMKIIVLAVCVFFLTGCFGGRNVHTSPENVAREMVNRLSSGDFENISDLLGNLYVPVTKERFEEFLNNNNFNLYGNTTIDLVDDPDLDERLVKFAIDNNRIIELATKEINGRWYVDLSAFMDEDIEITVPVGSTVKLDGTDISSQRVQSNQPNNRRERIRTGVYFTYEARQDVYIIPALFPGEYVLEVENDKTVTFEGIIHSNSRSFQGTYTHITVDRELNSYQVILSLRPAYRNAIIEFYKGWYQSFLDAVEARQEFSTLNRYIDTSNAAFLNTYNSTRGKIEREGPNHSRVKVSDMRLTDVRLNDNLGGVIYLGENRFALFVTTNFSYERTTSGGTNPGGNRTENRRNSIEVFIELELHEGRYRIIGGNPIFQME